MTEKTVPVIGQWVMVSSKGGTYVGKIERVTKTMFFIEGSSTKFRHDCDIVGQDTWNTTTAQFVTEEQVLAFRLKEIKAKRIETLKNNMSRLDYDRLDEISILRLESFFPKYLKQAKKS